MVVHYILPNGSASWKILLDVTNILDISTEQTSSCLTSFLPSNKLNSISMAFTYLANLFMLLNLEPDFTASSIGQLHSYIHLSNIGAIWIELVPLMEKTLANTIVFV